MADHLKFERYYWFDSEVRRGAFPNANCLARRFEISAKTAQRTIDFMRDRLGAPLDYDSHRKGYYYTESGFALPPFEVAQNELLAVLLAQNLLAGAASGVISHSIRSFGRKLFAATGSFGLSEARVNEAFSAVWHGFAPAEAETFRIVADALVQRRQLAFHYFAPSTNAHTERLVEPHHLQHYMGGWVLLARCLDRDDWRKFHLGRMHEVRLSAQPFTPRPASEWQEQLGGAFGIFQGGASVRVVLRFNPFRARWVRDELWHVEQSVEELADGSLLLSFAVADFREVKLRILQFGADVEVVEPVELRDEIMAEIGRMAELYKKG
ncbi:helix-turn-helix transcriptional regulator [Geotalea uraniireducens]|uniref:Transcriptional regulator-like protein n=1 Tax=Geotalea uraniireducens (strain Rf4) TaxID=351605 RepID=A5G6Z1_GEOUR|nr:WYL domain-containing protein [Geotalea uraniireducens]ABQ27559.1 transcriptional regulator-like protein [Geotalea uraniireducens Rf4]